MALPEIDLPVKLLDLRNRGWIRSHRKSDTGLGKTVEDLLGIKENNAGEPDCTYRGNEIEIKCHRVGSGSMITLFTLEAGIRHLNDVQLMQKYGYTDVKRRLALKITLTTANFTPQQLKLKSDPEGGTISIVDNAGSEPWIWTTKDLRLKLHNLCLVYAASRKEEGVEYFQIQRAVLAVGLDDSCFFKLMNEGLVKIDLRMHLKESGASRNHGTAFRLSRWEDIVNCYETQTEIL